MAIYSVDFGHGTGQDRGAEGYRNEEHDCREYGNLVVQKLRKLGHTVIDCTPSASPALTLSQSLAYRVNKANASGSILHICMHVNAFEKDKANGCEVEYISATGKTYADKICAEISNSLGYKNRGSQLRTGLYVLKHTKMVGVLIEPYFCDNKENCDKYNAEKLATAIVKGITGVDTTVQTKQINTTTVKPTQVAPKYDENIPQGVYQIPGTAGYIEQATDGRLIIHKDKGNYVAIGKGFIDGYTNDNNGHGDHKRICG